MSINQFNLLCLLLIKKHEGKLWGEVFPSCYSCDKSNVVTIKNFTLLNGELIFGTCVLAMIFKSVEKKFKVTLFLFDSFGLGLFTIVGIQKGLNADLHPLICVTLGTITGCFGGILRDILLNRIPLIFRKEIYATACIVGGSVFLLLVKYTPLSYTFVQVSTILLIVAIRTLAVKFHWQMPKFYGNDNASEM